MKKTIKNIISFLIIFSVVFSGFAIPAFADDQKDVNFDWKRYFSGNGPVLRDYASPVIDANGNVYLDNLDGYLYSIAPNKILNWKYDIHNVKQGWGSGASGASQPVVDENGIVYSGSSDRKVYAISEEGNKIWDFEMKTAISIGSSLAVDSGRNIIYAIDENGCLYAIDRRTGEQVWQQVTKTSQPMTPVVSRTTGTIYIADRNFIKAFMPNGDEKWSKHIESSLYTADGSGTENKVFLDAAENIYFITQDSNTAQKLNVINSDMKEMWSLDIYKLMGNVVLANDKVYFLTKDNRFHALNVSDRKEVLNTKVDELYQNNYVWCASSVSASADGTVYASIGYNIYAFDKTGDLKWKTVDGSQFIKGISKVGPNGEVYCSNANNLWKITDQEITRVPSYLNVGENFSMIKGSKYNLEVELRDEYGNLMELNNLNFSSSNQDILSIDQAGNATALKAGKAVITVASSINDTLTDSVEVNVIEDTTNVNLSITLNNTEILVGEKMKIEAFLNDIEGKEVKGESIEFESLNPEIVSINASGIVEGLKEGSATISAKVQGKEIYNRINITSSKFILKKVTQEELQESIDATLNYYRGRSVINADWEAFAINAVGADVSKFGTSGRTYLNELEAKIKANGVGGQMTDYERTALGILSAGGDPTNFAGQDLVDKILKWPDLSQGINAPIWGLIALDAANATEKQDSIQTREKLITYILEHKSGAGWNFSEGPVPDPDMTGMALYALAPYKDRQDVKQSCDEAFKWLSQEQREDGGFVSWGTVNSESCSQVMCAVTAWGIDPQGDQFTKSKGNLLTALLGFQVKDGAQKGMFKHTTTPDPGFGTQQGLYGLASAKDYFEKGNSTIFYKISTNSTEGEITELNLYPKTLKIKKDQTFELILKDQNGKIIQNTQADWMSNDESLIEVTQEGVITAKASGKTNIFIQLKGSEGAVTDGISVEVIKEDFTIEEVSKENSSDEKVSVSFRITNISEEDQNALCVIGLYDKTTNELVHMSYMSKEFEGAEDSNPGESFVINGEFDLADVENYKMKVLIWDDWFKGRVLGELEI